MESNASGSALSWMTELSRALDQGIQTAGTFLETNSALLANTLALDKLSEFDGVEARGAGLPGSARARTQRTRAAQLRLPGEAGEAGAQLAGGSVRACLRNPDLCPTARLLRSRSRSSTARTPRRCRPCPSCCCCRSKRAPWRVGRCRRARSAAVPRRRAHAAPCHAACRSPERAVHELLALAGGGRAVRPDVRGALPSRCASRLHCILTHGLRAPCARCRPARRRNRCRSWP
jgi:hypothetical protein